MAENTVQQPAPGQKTDNQPTRWWGGCAFSCGIGGTPSVSEAASASGAWPYWGGLLVGSYGTYRAMCRHATIAFALSQVLGPLLGSDWIVDADEDAPQEAKDWIKANVIDHRDYIMPHALRSVVFGNSPFEVVWAVQGRQFTVAEYVPLSQDITQVQRARSGKGPINGLRNGDVTLAPAEFLYILNNSDLLGAEPGDDYGRSRLENIRDTAWPGWLDSARRLAELEDRVSGVVPYIIVPPGSPPGAATNDDGSPKSYAQLAAAAVPDLVHPRSQGIVLETPAAAVDYASDGNPGAAKMLQTTVATLDMGDRAGSQGQMLEKLRYWDNMIGRGLYRGERTLFATDGGTKADAGEHDKNAEPDQEAIDNMIAEQINCQPVRVGLTLNFGPDVLKKVRGIKPKPLVDRERQDANRKIDEMIQGQKSADAMLNFLDMDKLAAQAGVPVVAKWIDVMSKLAEERNANTPQMNGQQDGQPVNGNGQASGRAPISRRVQKIARRLVGDN